MITGAAGYVGEMLCEQFSKRDDVETVIALDKQPQPDFLKKLSKVVYIEQNLADSGWQNKILPYMPDTIVHTAWQIRAMYGKEAEQRRWNVEGAKAVFEFAFSNRFVKKLVHFSTAASYSARPDNQIDHYFTEAEGLREDDYVYAKEKKIVEEELNNIYESYLNKDEPSPQLTVLRPAAITGPRGRHLRVRFGLQSALQGNFGDGFVNSVIKSLTAFMPATKGWVRQFIHEDDVVDVVEHVVFARNAWSYEVFNLTPTGDPVFAPAMAKVVGKKVLPVYPWMVRLAFWLLWHLTRGRVPTCAGAWRFYSYPILMSGDKLTAIYRCRYSSLEAISFTDGRYGKYIADNERRSALGSS